MMQTAHLHPAGKAAIPVQVAQSGRTTLVECRAPERFLAHLTEGRWSERLAPDVFLRGVILPDEGALFSLCGPLGVIADEVVRLSVADARRLVLDLLW